MERSRLYAKIKGFDKLSILARKALFAYMDRLPLTKAQLANAVLHIAVRGHEDESCD